MSLKIKAREKLMKFSKDSEGVYRWVMQPELYSALSQDKVIREAALRSGVSEGVMHACWDAAGEVIKAWATEGHSVALPGLGSMRFSLSAKTVADVNDVKTSLIKTRRIVFTPAVELKDELHNTSVIITCYDRNGNEVKRVTSADPGTVEDNKNENQNQNDPSTGSGQENENGGGSNTNDTNGTNGSSENGGGTGTITPGDGGGDGGGDHED